MPNNQADQISGDSNLMMQLRAVRMKFRDLIFLRDWAKEKAMPVIKTVARYVRKTIRRFVKGVFLVAWITVLLFLSLAALSNSASKFIIELVSYYDYSSYYYYDTSIVHEPLEYLENFTNSRINPPPIDEALSVLDGDPGWGDRDISIWAKETDKVDDFVYANWFGKQYESLFRTVETQLHRIARNPKINAQTAEIHNDGFPPSFKTPTDDKSDFVHVSEKLPPNVVAWVESERIRLSSEASKVALIDTFLLLIVLGAFGSLIFLTRDYIDIEHRTTIAAYIFRPVLGMFLAMAMFIVTLLGHAIVSTGDILQIRHETLYGLALAAGLLSEQAYGVVNDRAKAALQKLQEERGE